MAPSLSAPLAQALAGIAGARIRRHSEFAAVIRSPADFAEALGYAPDRIVKTLFLADRSAPKARRMETPAAHYAGAALAANLRIDMKAAAQALSWSGCELASAEELQTVTGFPPRGVSPLGLPVPLLMDAGLMAHETILVGGGAEGVEIELSPHALAEAVAARIVSLARA